MEFRKSENLKFMFLAATVLAVSGSTYSAEASWTMKKFSGNVSIDRKGGKVPASADLELKSGDTIATEADGKAYLQDGESEIWVGSSSRLKMHKLIKPDSDGDGRMDLLLGKVRAHFKRPSGPQEFPYKIRARSVVAGVRGTEFFISVDKSDEKVCTLEGLVRVTSLHSSSELWDVAAGKGLFVKPGEMPKVRETSKEQMDEWKKQTDIN